MKKTKYVLLVIDMQLVAFDGKITPPIVDGDEILQKTAELINICRRRQVPVVYLQTCAYPGRPYARDMHGWKIHPAITPEDGDPVVHKVLSSGFENTGLQALLEDTKVTGVITCGNWSEACVTATSLDAATAGYDVWLAADAHGTVRDTPEAAREVVESQNRKLADDKIRVLTVAEVDRALAGLHS